MIASLFAGVMLAISAQPCSEGAVRLETGFPGAGGGSCEREEDGFAITVKPETQPINNSPWYAFDIVSDRPAKVRVSIDYEGGRHRYWPKILDGDAWRSLPEEAVSVAGDRSRAILTFKVNEGRTRLAAQPLEASAERIQWAEEIADRLGLQLREIGTSAEGRSIPGLERVEKGKPLVVLVASQHPPEVPGWIAFRAFAERLAESDGERFLSSVSLLVVPVLNPDGIDGGHWRANAEGVDLNRDWGPFTQLETAAILAAIDQASAEGARPALLLDFHATFKGDLLYTPETEPLCTGKRFVEAFSEDLSGPELFEPQASFNPGYPSAKSWFLDRWCAPGITVEIGDRTSPQDAKALGRAVAESLMNAGEESLSWIERPRP